MYGCSFCPLLLGCVVLRVAPTGRTHSTKIAYGAPVVLYKVVVSLQPLPIQSSITDAVEKCIGLLVQKNKQGIILELIIPHPTVRILYGMNDTRPKYEVRAKKLNYRCMYFYQVECAKSPP